MKREDLEEWLNTKWLGRNLQMMEETDSTNQRAKTAAATGEQEGLVIVAEQQTSGRGRRGRGWISPPGENIYMTMLLRPAFDPGRAPMLTLLAACAAARAAMEPGHESPRIKWPNDLVIGGKNCWNSDGNGDEKKPSGLCDHRRWDQLQPDDVFRWAGTESYIAEKRVWP